MISPLANFYGNNLMNFSNDLDTKHSLENTVFHKLNEEDKHEFSLILTNFERVNNDSISQISEEREIKNILLRKINKVRAIPLPKQDYNTYLKIPVRPKNPFYKNFQYK